ncbi:DUF4153 domain-containing protein [Cronobacter turicensis]|uniref:DUF4153 domain-containing protein n=1 Tax=Cronobacter turicensis TaxID=413502 RepID=UPI000CFB5A65|nr:DUF4153 domain-containing protein [Cronobacter turicensis]
MSELHPLAPATRWGIVMIAALCGLLMFLTGPRSLIVMNQGSALVLHSLAITLCASVALAATRLRALRFWLMTGALLALVGVMAGWMRWSVTGVDELDAAEMVANWYFHLAVTLFMALPWLQRDSVSGEPVSRRLALWNNGVALLLALALAGLFWGVLLLWAKLFSAVNIRFFDDLFFDTPLFGYVMVTVSGAVCLLLCRSQTRITEALIRFLTLVASGLLPLAALIALLFLVTLPFVGLSGLAERTSCNALLNTLALVLLSLSGLACAPWRSAPPPHKALRLLNAAGLIATPLFSALAGWSLWLRVQQYGWTPSRVYAALITATVLCWAVCAALQAARRMKRSEPASDRGGRVVMLFSLALLILSHSPVLDPWRISVESQMARYESGAQKADLMSLYMLQHAGRRGQAALNELRNNTAFMADRENRQALRDMLDGDPSSAVNEADLRDVISLASGAQAPAESWWQWVRKEDTYSVRGCLYEKGSCVVAALDLNHDGQNEVLLCNSDTRSCSVTMRENGQWRQAGWSLEVPGSLTREKFDTALRENQIKGKDKTWQDVEIGGVRIPISYQ